jgi:osmotically-inducible protein OsmY
VADVAAKKLALELAASVRGVDGIIDRLRVSPGERRGDGAVRDSLARMLLEQPEFRNCTLRSYTNEHRAEPDAWALLGVERVINRLQVTD